MRHRRDDNLEAQQQRAEQRQRARDAELRVRRPERYPTKTLVVGHVEYEVAWDGSLDGAHARGIPRADERPGGYGDGHFASGQGKKNSTVQTVSSKTRSPSGTGGSLIRQRTERLEGGL